MRRVNNFQTGTKLNKYGYDNRKITRSIPLIVFSSIAVILALTVPHFLSSRNIVNLLTQSAAIGLMAIGMSIVLILGGIDLSMPAVMAFSGIIGAIFMREGGNPVLASLIMIAIGAAAGCINGLAVAWLKMIPFIVTLSMQAIITGSSIWVTNARSVFGLPDSFANTVLWKIGIIPLPVVIVIFITIYIQVLMKRSILGRWMYATGTNADASQVAGIPTRNVIFVSYILSGLFAGVAAIIVTARLGSAAVTMGSGNVVLDIISAAVVGGVSIYGGVGTAVGAVTGAVFITLISNSMNLLHVPYYLTLLIKGFVIIGVVAVDSMRNK